MLDGCLYNCREGGEGGGGSRDRYPILLVKNEMKFYILNFKLNFKNKILKIKWNEIKRLFLASIWIYS